MWWWTMLLACGEADPGDPTPEPEPDTATPCAAGEVRDGEACVPEACGVGRWGSLEIDGTTVHVHAAAAPGGDGTASAPLTSVQAGVDLAGERGGGRVVVAAGTYPEAVAMGVEHDGVALLGRCKERVTLDASGAAGVPALKIAGVAREPGPDVRVAGLTVTGGRETGIWVERAKVEVAASDVRANEQVGVLAPAADLTLTAVSVVGTLADRRGAYGYGVELSGGTTFVATDCVIDGNVAIGLHVRGAGTTATLTRTAVDHTASNPDGAGGQGIDAQEGAVVDLDASTVRGNAGAGVAATGAGTRVSLVGSTVADTRPLGDGSAGRGIEVNDGGEVVATTSLLTGNVEVGVLARGTGASVRLEDTQVHTTAPSADGSPGAGVLALEGATIHLEGGEVAGNHTAGVGAGDADTRVELVDTWVTGTLATPDGRSGRGVDVEDGATMTLTGVTVEDSVELGAFAEGVGTSLTLSGSTVTGTTPGAPDAVAMGVRGQQGAAVLLDGCDVAGHEGIGVIAGGAGTTLELVDTTVRDTRRGTVLGFAVGVVAESEATVHATGLSVSGTEGPGIYAAEGGSIDLAGGTLGDNRFAGALVVDGTLRLDGLVVSGTGADAEWGGGFGIYAAGAFGPSAITLTGSTIGPHPYAAVWLDGPGSYDVHDNALSGSEGVERAGRVLHGNAVFAERGVAAWDGVSGLRLAGNLLSDADPVAVLLDGATATLTDNTWSGNAVDVWQQGCADTTPLTDADLAGVPGWTRCPDHDRLVDFAIRFDTLYLPDADPRD